MNRKLLALCAVFLVALAVIPAPAVSGRATALALNPSVGPPTSLVKAKGSGFAGGEVIALFFDGDRVGSVVAGPTGRFNARFTVPAAARPGDHSVEAVGQSSGLAARALFLVRTDWLQGCFDGGRSCFNCYENVIGPGNAGGLSVAWRAPAGADGSSSPVYANGRLFVGTASGLLGLDPATGTIIINDRSGPVSTTPAVIRGLDPQPDPPGKVIFGSTDGVLHALSTTGEELWRVGLGAAPASPLVIQGFGDPGGSFGDPGGSRIVVGARDTLFAFDGDGNRLWATVLEGGDISKAAAVLTAPPEPERVIVAAGNTLYALDATTGAVIWTSVPSGRRLGAPSIGEPTIIGDPNVLVGDQTGTLYSIDPASGAVGAKFAAGGPVSGSPAIGDPNVSQPWVFVGDSGGNIYAFDQTDEFPPPEWSAALGGPIDGSPVLANGVLYAATDPAEGDPHIAALDQETGRTLFDALLPGGVASPPIVAYGRLVVATRNGEVIAYEGPDS